MTLLKDILNFFWREKGWAILFFVLVGIVAAVVLRPDKPVEKRPSEAMRELRQAEAELKEQIKASGGLQGFLASRPSLVKAFSIFTSFLLTVFFLGLVVDFLWFTNAGWRRQVGRATGPPEAKGWGLSTVFKVIVLFVLATLSLSLLLSFVKSFMLRNVSPNFYLLIHTTLSDLFIVGIIITFFRRRGGSWRNLGFSGIQPWRDFWIGLTGYVGILPLFVAVLIGLVILVQWLAYEPPPHPLVEIFIEEEKRAPWIIAYSVFLGCVAGPVFEEIFFRGFCYPAFKRRWGVGWALVLSSAFFSMIHQNAFAFLPVFILGLGLGYLYERRGNLMPSIVLHVIHNTVFISYFFLAKEILKGNL